MAPLPQRGNAYQPGVGLPAYPRSSPPTRINPVRVAHSRCKLSHNLSKDLGSLFDERILSLTEEQSVSAKMSFVLRPLRCYCHSMERTFRPALLPLTALALTGFALSLAVHILALLGSPTPFGKEVWMLHLGIFIVFPPAVLISLRMKRGAGRKEFSKTALNGWPLWMRATVALLFVYAIVNFFICFGSTAGQRRDKYAKVEDPSTVLRGFSGHWLLFYGIAFATLYSAYMKGSNTTTRRCINGHSVPVTANICDKCGAILGPSISSR